MNKGISDEHLVQCILDGDKEAFGELVERYQKKLTYYIKRISNVSDEDIEDILQDSFIKAYQNLESFDNKLKFSSWIYRIVYNHVIDTHRKKTSKGRDKLIKVDDNIISVIGSELDTADLAEYLLDKKYIEEALNRMDTKYREVIILKYFEEKDYKEISDILRKPVNTIATLLNRAKKRLRIEINYITKEYYEHKK